MAEQPHFPTGPVQAYTDNDFKALRRGGKPTQYVDDAEAAKTVQRVLDFGDQLRTDIRKMRTYKVGEYEALSHKAARFIDTLESDASDFNFASLLRTRAIDPRTKDHTYINMMSPGTMTEEEIHSPVLSAVKTKDGLGRMRGAKSEKYTYAEADKEASKARRMFEDMGIGRGAHVVVRCICPEHVLARNAVLGSGGIIAPLSVRYHDSDFLGRLKLVNADAVVTTPDMLRQTLEMRRRMGKEFKIFVVERDPHTGEKLEGTAKQELLDQLKNYSDVYPYLTIKDKYQDTPAPIVKVTPGQQAFSMMTSGSTGELKEVQIPHSYGLASYVRSNPWWGVNGAATKDEYNSAKASGDKPIDKVFCTAPPGWMYFYRGLTCAEMAGAEFTFYKMPDNKLNIGFLDKVLKSEETSVLAGIPSIFRELASYHLEGVSDEKRNGLDQPFGVDMASPGPLTKEDGTPHIAMYPRMRRAISTGEPLNPQTRSDFTRLTNLPIANCYAATEEGPMIGQPEGLTLPGDTVGVALPGVEFQLINELGERKIIAHSNEPTMFAVRQTGISSKYRYPSGGADRGVYTDPNTGEQYRNMGDDVDIAHGRPELIERLSRMDDLIKRKATQIFPIEIEGQFARAFPNRQLNCTVGIHDAEKTNTVVSYIEIPREEYEAMGRNDTQRSEEVSRRVHRVMSDITPTKRPDYVFVAPVDYDREHVVKDPYRDLRTKFAEILQTMKVGPKYSNMRGGVILLPDVEAPIEHAAQHEIDSFLTTAEIQFCRQAEPKPGCMTDKAKRGGNGEDTGHGCV